MAEAKTVKTPKGLKASARKPSGLKSAVKKAAKIRDAKREVEGKEIAEPAEKTVEPSHPPTERYWEGVGRRKTAVARVRIYTRGDKGLWVNGRPLAEYFTYAHLQHIASAAVEIMKSFDRFRVVAKVKGGGIHAQAEAVRHGSARALVLFNSDFRKRLKREGMLTRDSRMVERKKFGLKKARRAPQWAKR